MKKDELMGKSKKEIIDSKKETVDKGKKIILVVDDDVNMLNLIKICLEDLYDVVIVPSGKLALKYLSKKSADLILLDYMMPGDDGPEILKKIRENQTQSEIPVIFLTGVDEKNMVMRGLELHPDAYLLKPVTRKALLEKITTSLTKG